VIASVDDALALMGLPSTQPVAPDLHTAAERQIWEVLARGPCDLETLATISGLPARDCMAAVTTLELRGAVVCDLTGEVRRGE
jgi:predicted Rossmann fold nucleotide-binding protein DprA/Smf involved in DNA uptake